jgi:hypothetical protein
MSFLSASPCQVLLNLILYGQALRKKKLACFSIIKKKIKIKINKTKMFVLAFFLSLGF